MVRSSTEVTPEPDIEFDIRRTGKGEGLFVKCSLYGTDVNFLVDTGANATILHPEKFYSIPAEERPELQTFGGRLRMADGQLIPVIGRAKVSFQVHPQVPAELHSVLVAAVEAPGVLGYDFLHEHDCCLELGPGQLTIRGKKLPCMQEDQMTSVFKVTLKSTVTVPPCSEMMVPGLIQGDLSGCQAALVEPDEKIVESSEIVVTGQVIDHSQETVPIGLVYVLDDSCVLQKNSVVGICEAVDELVENPESGELFCIEAADCRDVPGNSEGLPEHVAGLFRRSFMNVVFSFYECILYRMPGCLHPFKEYWLKDIVCLLFRMFMPLTLSFMFRIMFSM